MRIAQFIYSVPLEPSSCPPPVCRNLNISIRCNSDADRLESLIIFVSPDGRGGDLFGTDAVDLADDKAALEDDDDDDTDDDVFLTVFRVDIFRGASTVVAFLFDATVSSWRLNLSMRSKSDADMSIFSLFLHVPAMLVFEDGGLTIVASVEIVVLASTLSTSSS